MKKDTKQQTEVNIDKNSSSEYSKIVDNHVRTRWLATVSERNYEKVKKELKECEDALTVATYVSSKNGKGEYYRKPKTVAEKVLAKKIKELEEKCFEAQKEYLDKEIEFDKAANAYEIFTMAIVRYVFDNAKPKYELKSQPGTSWQTSTNGILEEFYIESDDYSHSIMLRAHHCNLEDPQAHYKINLGDRKVSYVGTVNGLWVANANIAREISKMFYKRLSKEKVKHAIDVKKNLANEFKKQVAYLDGYKKLFLGRTK